MPLAVARKTCIFAAKEHGIRGLAILTLVTPSREEPDKVVAVAGIFNIRGAMSACALGLALIGGTLSAQTVSLAPSEVRALAASTLQAGNPADAALAADLLLQTFPDDPSTLLIRTEAAILLEDFAGAVTFGQRAFWNAVNNRQRFNAARLAALGHARQLHYSRAQLWLRLARQNAPNEAASQAVAEDFQAIRRQNPLTVNLRFGITPSTNINNGIPDGTFELLGLPFVINDVSQFALSGWEFSGGVDLRYRLRTDRTSATFLNFGLNGRTYTLTEGSEDLLDRNDDDTTGHDFSTATLSFGVTHRFVLGQSNDITEAGLSYGRTFREDASEREWINVTAGHSINLDDLGAVRLNGLFQQSRRIENGDKVQTASVSATYSNQLEGVGSFSFGVTLRNNLAEDLDEDYDSVQYRLGYAPEQLFQGIAFGLNASFEEQEYATNEGVFASRKDEVTVFEGRATFTEVELFGFQPVVSLSHVDRQSSADFFSRSSTNFGFDLRSAF